MKSWSYPRAEIARMFAPLDRTPPADRLRSLLRSRFEKRGDPQRPCHVHTAGAYDALTASLLTDLGFETIHAGGSQLSLSQGLCPDLGIHPANAIVALVREALRGIEGTRDRRFSESGEVIDAPPVFADLGPGAGGPLQTFALARELIRAGAAGLHLDDRDPDGGPRALAPARRWLEKLFAVKAAAQAMDSSLVVIARTDAACGATGGDGRGAVGRAVERALEAAALGVDVLWPQFADADLDGPRRFAEEVLSRHPDQMLAFDFLPGQGWAGVKRRGEMPTNRQLGAMGYVLQFSSLFAFRTAGMALEAWLRGFKERGLDALADLQLVEEASLDREPRTRRPQSFAGSERWLALDRAARRKTDREV